MLYIFFKHGDMKTLLEKYKKFKVGILTFLLVNVLHLVV